MKPLTNKTRLCALQMFLFTTWRSFLSESLFPAGASFTFSRRGSLVPSSQNQMCFVVLTLQWLSVWTFFLCSAWINLALTGDFHLSKTSSFFVFISVCELSRDLFGSCNGGVYICFSVNLTLILWPCSNFRDIRFVSQIRFRQTVHTFYQVIRSDFCVQTSTTYLHVLTVVVGTETHL